MKKPLKKAKYGMPKYQMPEKSKSNETRGTSSTKKGEPGSGATNVINAVRGLFRRTPEELKALAEVKNAQAEKIRARKEYAKGGAVSKSKPIMKKTSKKK